MKSEKHKIQFKDFINGVDHNNSTYIEKYGRYWRYSYLQMRVFQVSKDAYMKITLERSKEAEK